MATTWKTKLKVEARLGAEVDEAAAKTLADKANKESAAVGPDANKVSAKALSVKAKEKPGTEAFKALANEADKEPTAAKVGAEANEDASKVLVDEADKEPNKVVPAVAKKAIPSVEDDDSTMEAYVEPILEESTSITIDENVSLDYQMLADTA